MRGLYTYALAALALAGCGRAAAIGPGGATAATTPAPSLDCAAAARTGARVICDDPTLARLDAELARLYGVALNGPTLVGRRGELEALQHDALAARDACDGPVCVRDAYVAAIGALRRNYPDVRGDVSDISRGPMVARCAGVDADIYVTIVEGEAPLAHLAWGRRSVVLPAIPSASGAHYVREVGRDEYEYWDHGGEALFQSPGRPQTHCAVSEG